MSTIVAIVKNGKACIAADSLTTFGDIRQSSDYDLTSEKILQHKDSYVGIVGCAAHHHTDTFSLQAKKVSISGDTLPAPPP